jgi:hypothetical protein
MLGLGFSTRLLGLRELALSVGFGLLSLPLGFCAATPARS